MRSSQLNHSNNEQPLDEVHGILSENSSYQNLKYILCDIKKSNKYGVHVWQTKCIHMLKYPQTNGRFVINHISSPIMN
jgi:hypothetical protein